MPQTSDPWLAGEPYERFMGRWSRLMAGEFIRWLAPRPGLHWLELGCGTGALTETILAEAWPASLLAVDPSEAFIAFARQRLSGPHIAFHVGNASDAPADPGSIDLAASGLVLNFVPEPVAALQALGRSLRPDGMIAVYVWDYADEMQMLRSFWDAAAALNPAARSQDEGVRFPICQPDALRNAFAEAGFSDIEVTGLRIETRFMDFDDYWSPFLGGQGPAAGYVAGLSEPDREALKDRLRASLPPQADSSIRLTARAWAARAGSRTSS